MRGVIRPDETGLRDLLTTGTETFDRNLVSSVSGTMASQSLRLTFFTARKTHAATSINQWTGTTAAANDPTLVRCGLYSEAANGDITLIASTPNDAAATLLGAASTEYTKAFSVATTLIAGARYAVGWLVVTAAAMPTFPCWSVNILPAAEMLKTPKRTASVAAQADLPSSVVNASLAASGLAIYSVILP